MAKALKTSFFQLRIMVVNEDMNKKSKPVNNLTKEGFLKVKGKLTKKINLVLNNTSSKLLLLG